VIDAAWADRVVSPMHDEIDPATREAILASNPWSYLHVTHSPGRDCDHAAAVEDNAAALGRILDAGAFRLRPDPAMYVYRLRNGDHAQTGVVAEIPAADVAEGRLLGHETVQPARVEALVRHFERIAPRSDLVALMHARDEEVERVVESCCRREPLLSITSDDGLEQTVWRLDRAEDVVVIERRLGEPQLFITDGHHRVAAATKLWEERGRPDALGVLCVVFPQDELRVLAFHRRVAGPVDPATTLARIRERAEVEPRGDERGSARIRLYLDRAWHGLVPRPDPEAGGLDVEWLHREVLEPVFSVTGPEDPRLELASELVPLERLVAMCDADRGALFALRAPDVSEIVRVARRGGVMPPKTTYFDPKPRSGVFLRLPG
jgi:uncharacterized protein (DUF1015 family)